MIRKSRIAKEVARKRRPKRVPIGAQLRANGAKVVALPLGTSWKCRDVGGAIEISIVGMVLPSEANRSRNEHWSRTRERTNSKRDRVGVVAWAAIFANAPSYPIEVTITRVAPRALDSDNRVSAAKAVRDGIADALGIDDRDPRVRWIVEAERGPVEVRIRIETQGPRKIISPHATVGVACA